MGHNPVGNGRKKCGLKVHMLIDAVQLVDKFIRINEAYTNNKNFLDDIQVPANSLLVFDKAYTDHSQFVCWTE